MKRAAFTAALMLLSSCASQAPEAAILLEPPAGALYAQPERPLPVLGRIEADYDGRPTVWETLDFSVGAVDPSANIGRYDDITSVFVAGYLPGQENREAFGRLEIRATLPQGAAPGPGTDVSIAVIDTPGHDAPRFASAEDSSLEVTRITPPADEGEIYGSIAGRFAATLCRAANDQAPSDPSDCRTISGRFETAGSFNNLR